MATRKGSMPMFIRRLIVEGASLVCRVEKHEVTGERCLDRHLRGFKIADLTHQDGVGILPQEGAQSRGEVEPDRLFHLYLIDARQVELHRIFRRHDVGFRRVDGGKRRVEGVGLTRTGGPGDQHHAVGLADGVLELGQGLDFEAGAWSCRASDCLCRAAASRSSHRRWWAARRRD